MQGALSGLRLSACSTSYSPCAPPLPRMARAGRACGVRIECVSSEMEAGTAESTSSSRAAEPRPPSLAAPRRVRRSACTIPVLGCVVRGPVRGMGRQRCRAPTDLRACEEIG